MMRDSGEKQAKVKLETVLELRDGSSILGVFFVTPQARLTDLLNDSREFVPIEMTDGTLTVVRKDAIMRATPLQQKTSGEAIDPYSLLNVSSGVSHDDLKAAYHKMCQDFHPDKLQSLGLPPHFLEFGSTQMARINDAYERICREKNFGREELAAS